MQCDACRKVSAQARQRHTSLSPVPQQFRSIRASSGLAVNHSVVELLPNDADPVTKRTMLALDGRGVSDNARPGLPTSVAGRMLDVLGCFSGPRVVLGVTEIAVRIGMPKSTTHRMLSVMLRHGFVRREGQRYRLAKRVFELSARAADPHGLREAAIPYMTELHHATGETVHLAVLESTDVLYVQKVYGHGSTPCPTTVGGCNPANCTALGKAILSRSGDEIVERVLYGRLQRLTNRSLYTPEVLGRCVETARTQGFAVDNEECRPGLACVAVPILDRSTGEAVAALSISARTSRFNKPLFAASLVKAANNLSRVGVPL